MNFPLFVDLSDLALEFSLTKSDVDDMVEFAVKEVTAEIARNWDTQARLKLNSTRDTYRRSIIVGQSNRTTAFVELVGAFPNMLENGMSSFDIKTHFQNSGKAKTSKSGGWYLTVPFRFATPNSVGGSSVFDNVLPDEVYQAIKATVSKTQTQIGGQKSGGGSLHVSDIPSSFAIPKSRAAFSDLATKTTFDKYQHKTSIYAGISEMSKTYENSQQSTYVSFRRASDNSSPDSWIHKGITAYNLHKLALQNTRVDYIVDRSIDIMLQKIMQ